MYIFDCESRNRASGSRAPILLKYYCRLLGANFSEGHGTCILSPLHEQIERARSMRSSRRIVLSDGLPRYRDTRVLPLSTITESRSTRTSVLYRINRSYVFPRRFDLLFSTCRDSSFEIARIFGRLFSFRSFLQRMWFKIEWIYASFLRYDSMKLSFDIGVILFI